MAIMSHDPTGEGQARWTMRWKTALNAFDITFSTDASQRAVGNPNYPQSHRSFDSPRLGITLTPKTQDSELTVCEP
jgi:hypothetical protein